MLLTPSAGQAQLRWTTNSGTITITGYSYTGSGEVVIPDTITGLPVTSIGDSAFFVEDGLTSVTIPSSVTRIGDRAFSYCAILNSVMIGTGVTRIGDGAFQGCNSLTNVTIPPGVTSIGSAAFLGCAMISVTIPNSVTNIGVAVFSYCANLGAISVDALNSAYSSVAGVLFNTNKTVLIQFPGGKIGGYAIPTSVKDVGDFAFSGSSSLISVTIPDGVTSIGVSAFSECTGLAGVTLPVSVTSIGSGAFQSCIAMTNLMAPDSITSIGSDAFNNCSGLKSVTIPAGVTSIETGLFQNCSGLTNVTIPDNVLYIGDNAFAACANLTSAVISNNVLSIGAGAFYNCVNLVGVIIGSSVTSIGEGAFGACVGLNTITVNELNSVYSSVAGVLFNKHKTVLLQCPEGRTGTYAIPTSVTSIGSGAFSYCTSLISVTIPSSVTNIGVSAFDYCIGLTSVTVGDRVTSIGTYAFASCYSLARVFFQGDAPFVADSAFIGANMATVYYLPDTTGWGTTFGDRPAVLWNPQVQTSDASFGVRTNRFGFTITGANNLVIVVEASANPANPIWFPVGTNTLTGGSSYFSDPAWTNSPMRLYRLRSP
jgi:hypothetical protein